jgi:regulator of RNase E activity RraA
MNREILEVGKLLDSLRSVPSGFVADALQRLSMQGWLDPLRSSKPIPAVCAAGPAVTVQFAPLRGQKRSKRALYAIFREVAPGSVVVISAPYSNGYLLGANVCTAAIQAGIKALVIDGYIRDLADIEKLDLAVFFRGTNVIRESGSEIIAVNEPVICAGATVHSGDIVAVDEDGGLVFPSEYLAVIVDNVREIGRLEQEQAEIIRTLGPLEELGRVLAAKKAQHEP